MEEFLCKYILEPIMYVVFGFCLICFYLGLIGIVIFGILSIIGVNY